MSTIGSPRGVAAAAFSAASGVASRLSPDASSRPPWNRTVLDDLAVRRPWNSRVTWSRWVASRRRVPPKPGVTVVVVNWNTKEVTADVIAAVQALSPTDTKVLVLDNGSADGSREMLRSWPGIDTVLLRSNAGHGVALDLAVCSSRTSVTVTLDSDAVPLDRGWLDPVVTPVREGRAVLAGLRSTRGFVHPVFSAVDTAAFVQRRLSYQAHISPGVTSETVRWGENAWDTGELMPTRLHPSEVAFVEATPNTVPGLPGMTAGGVVYHHGGVSRSRDGLDHEAALEGWRAALASLGLSSAVDGSAKEQPT